MRCEHCQQLVDETDSALLCGVCPRCFARLDSQDGRTGDRKERWTTEPPSHEHPRGESPWGNLSSRSQAVWVTAGLLPDGDEAAGRQWRIDPPLAGERARQTERVADGPSVPPTADLGRQQLVSEDGRRRLWDPPHAGQSRRATEASRARVAWIIFGAINLLLSGAALVLLADHAGLSATSPQSILGGLLTLAGQFLAFGTLTWLLFELQRRQHRTQNAVRHVADQVRSILSVTRD